LQRCIQTRRGARSEHNIAAAAAKESTDPTHTKVGWFPRKAQTPTCVFILDEVQNDFGENLVILGRYIGSYWQHSKDGSFGKRQQQQYDRSQQHGNLASLYRRCLVVWCVDIFVASTPNGEKLDRPRPSAGTAVPSPGRPRTRAADRARTILRKGALSSVIIPTVLNIGCKTGGGQNQTPIRKRLTCFRR